MKSKVYFIPVSDNDNKNTITAKFNRLLDESDILAIIHKNDDVAVKLHFGEEGNTGFIKPEYIRCAVDEITKNGARPVVADTNTLYRGRRLNSKDHVKLAYEHGFTEDIVGAAVAIADGSEDVDIEEKFIKRAKLAPLFCRADAIVAISHFKGHLMTGFGGALKNLGMGCASREGKLAQHSEVAPFVLVESCNGCGECEKVCPVQAIAVIDGKSHVNISVARCIGCASCIAACPYEAIDVHWEAGAGNIQEKMTEYAKAVLKGKEKKSAFINFAIKITKECDCLAKDDPKISPDIGIFASHDPVGIDKACLDSVINACGRDIFKEAHPKRDCSKQLDYAFKLGIGNLDYELIKL